MGRLFFDKSRSMQHAHVCEFHTLTHCARCIAPLDSVTTSGGSKERSRCRYKFARETVAELSRAHNRCDTKTVKVDENSLFKLDRNENRNKMRNEHSFRR